MRLLPWASALVLATGATGAADTDPPDRPDRAWPVPDHRVLSAFRPPAEAWGAGHRGLDLPATTGTPVRAVAAGVIGFAGVVAGKPVVTLLLADGRRVSYEPVRATVAPGDRLAAGDVLGTVAATGGHCGGLTGCVHLGLRSGSTYLDPRTLLPRGSAVLKPWRSHPRPLADAPPRRWP